MSDRIGGAQLRLNSARRGRGDSGPRARADRRSPRRTSHGTSRFLSAPRLQFPNLEGGARYGFASFEGLHARRFAISRRPADHSPMPEGELNLSAVALPRCDGTDVGTHARKGVAPQPAFVIKVMLGNSRLQVDAWPSAATADEARSRETPSELDSMEGGVGKMPAGAEGGRAPKLARSSGDLALTSPAGCVEKTENSHAALSQRRSRDQAQ